MMGSLYRLKTLEAKVGSLSIGSSFPVRLQTMTVTDTMDTVATVTQVMKCVDAGADLVRITAPGLREAENLLSIKNSLRQNQCYVPLVADIHYTPNAAELAARIVEKVRINPGNYADKKKFEMLIYSDDTYRQELDRIRKRFSPLIDICKEYGTALRIGVNHGSLSDRIMSRYGDSAVGMVESAMEFLRIAEDLNFRNIVLSMKSSNPMVMIEAYRLLVRQMQGELQHCYPLHLGVTEAGDGLQGRIKSAIGIGTLLEEGIGDTIRVSLTEDPEFEIPVCRSIVNGYPAKINLSNRLFGSERAPTEKILNIGGEAPPVVVADLSRIENVTRDVLATVGYVYHEKDDKWNIGQAAADYIYVNRPLSFSPPGMLGIVVPGNVWRDLPYKENYFPLFKLEEYKSGLEVSDRLNLVLTDEDHTVLATNEIDLDKAPKIIQFHGDGGTLDDLIIAYCASAGREILNGYIDGIWLLPPDSGVFSRSTDVLNNISFGMLQATRSRISETDYISCPSCGRTLFDLQTTTEKIRRATNHLKGLKIAIMGCIVNGPGEMADADFGYVGSGVGKISLYKGKEIVQRNIESDLAVAALIDLIKEFNMWVDPPEVHHKSTSL